MQKQVKSKAREMAWREGNLEKVDIELAHLKSWKIGAKTEDMNAKQPALFEDTLAEEEASSAGAAGRAAGGAA